MRLWLSVLAIPAAVLAVLAADKEPPADAPPKPAEPGTLVVVDAAGKEQKLKTWKLAAGTRRLSWLAPARPVPLAPAKKPSAGADKPVSEAAEGAVGPEALVLRAETDIHFVEGVQTLIPMDRLRSLDYDNENETVTARVATGPGTEETLSGSTKYKKINKLVIEAEVDKGDLGIAEVRYLGGQPKGIRGVRFAAPTIPSRPPGGRVATVVSVDGSTKTNHAVTDLLPLYHVPQRGEQLVPKLAFRKTLKIDVAKIQKITAGEGEGDDPSWQVQLKDGGDEALILLPTLEVQGHKAVLVGLVGRVPCGYKLFPVTAISQITFDTAEKEPPP